MIDYIEMTYVQFSTPFISGVLVQKTAPSTIYTLIQWTPEQCRKCTLRIRPWIKNYSKVRHADMGAIEM